MTERFDTERLKRVMASYHCDQESAIAFINLREEGHGVYQASVMAGIADPHDPDPEEPADVNQAADDFIMALLEQQIEKMTGDIDLDSTTPSSGTDEVVDGLVRCFNITDHPKLEVMSRWEEHFSSVFTTLFKSSATLRSKAICVRVNNLPATRRTLLDKGSHPYFAFILLRTLLNFVRMASKEGVALNRYSVESAALAMERLVPSLTAHVTPYGDMETCENGGEVAVSFVKSIGSCKGVDDNQVYSVEMDANLYGKDVVNVSTLQFNLLG